MILNGAVDLSAARAFLNVCSQDFIVEVEWNCVENTMEIFPYS